MQPKGRKLISVTIFAAAAIASAVGGLVQPAVASAERVWDLEYYDNCIKNSTKLQVECCLLSGGDTDEKTGECVAPANAQAEPEVPAPGTLGVPGSTHTRPGKVSTLP